MEVKLGQPLSFCLLGRRSNQEDSRYPDADSPQDFAPFFLVCDGVGGCEKGEVASLTVCEAFGRILSEKDWHQPFSPGDFQQALNFALLSLRRKANGSNRDMATTLTFAAFHGEGCTVAHIGDSRIYHIRPGQGILYRSDDHSLVNSLVHSGNITPDEAIDHPDSNIITRYVGVPDGSQSAPKATMLLLDDIQSGDYLLLCTDGVLHMVTDNELLSLLSEAVDDKEKMRLLAQKCIDSPDNSTAYLIPVTEVRREHCDADCTDSVSPVTTPLHKRIEQVHDVLPAESPSLCNRVKEFVNRLFR